MDTFIDSLGEAFNEGMMLFVIFLLSPIWFPFWFTRWLISRWTR